LILHTTLEPQEDDCTPTMSYFQLILELRRDRSLLPTDGMMNAMENPACFGQTSFTVRAEGPRCRRSTMRIAGLWPCPILPLLFSEGKFGKSQFSGVPGLPGMCWLARVARRGERHSSCLLRQHHLDGACLKNS